MQRPPKFKNTTLINISMEQDFALGVGWYSITISWAKPKELGRMRRPYKIREAEVSRTQLLTVGVLSAFLNQLVHQVAVWCLVFQNAP